MASNGNGVGRNEGSQNPSKWGPRTLEGIAPCGFSLFIDEKIQEALMSPGKQFPGGWENAAEVIAQEWSIMAEDEKDFFRARAKGMLTPTPKNMSLVAESAITLIAVKVLNTSTSLSESGASSSGHSPRQSFRDVVVHGAGTLTKRKLYGPQHDVDLMEDVKKNKKSRLEADFHHN